MTREGYFRASLFMNDCADGIAKMLVGQAAGHASVFSIRSMSFETVSRVGFLLQSVLDHGEQEEIPPEIASGGEVLARLIEGEY